MTVPGSPLPTAAPIGDLTTPLQHRFAETSRGAGAAAGNLRSAHDIPAGSSPLHLSFEEAETVAADLARVWVGITGLSEVPKVENIADLLQRGLRKSREVIDARTMLTEDAN